jgi:hypothetical protein
MKVSKESVRDALIEQGRKKIFRETNPSTGSTAEVGIIKFFNENAGALSMFDEHDKRIIFERLVES